MSAASRFAAVTALLGRACRGLLHPVIATFLLAAILSFLAADTLSGVYLLVVGLALAGDRMRRSAPLPAPVPGAGPGLEPGQRPEPELAEPGPGERPGERPEPGPGKRAAERAEPRPGERAEPEPGERPELGPGERPELGPGERPELPAGAAGTAGPWAALSAESAAQRRAAMDRVRIPALIAAAAYAAAIGWLGRFTWPATVLAVIPAVAGLTVAWVASAESAAPPRRPGWGGIAAWSAVWVGAAIWEMTTLFLQPTLELGSYAHPTLSYLADQPLAAWPGRWAASFLWLALGWYLARR